ncbi:YgfZ/GcvT domain-containing protein [Rhodoferax saidenbachensis]|uniref:CAF17-like 4Fe-4S cluster assembly/insertion protein YgfZ n=1 Tax=Rhodoferax saidenbachensis TaxID=1484693 RepID=UPI0004AE35FF|nr:folate-binding protein YgfZ [Rhodoferax saidenbachensis]
MNGVAQLSHLGVIRIEGEDAAKFIHGQLTQDFSLLGLGEARLSAFCSAKGRMQASFIGFKRSNGDILLVGSRDILAPTLKRLSMFVMRAKAKLSDATEDFSLYGLSGNAIKDIAARAQPTWSKADFEATSVVNLYPAEGTPRQLWVAPAGTAAPAGDVLPLEAWLWSEVASGIATLTAPVVEAFVPQMLNYESVGGVNFKKGCYPGQEVVARSQFRGTLKRRAFVVHAEAAMAAGQEIFVATDPDQPVATVVQAAAAPGGGFEAIISAQLSALESGTLHLGSAAGPALQVKPLPYPLLEDI